MTSFLKHIKGQEFKIGAFLAMNYSCGGPEKFEKLNFSEHRSADHKIKYLAKNGPQISL